MHSQHASHTWYIDIWSSDHSAVCHIRAIDQYSVGIMSSAEERATLIIDILNIVAIHKMCHIFHSSCHSDTWLSGNPAMCHAHTSHPQDCGNKGLPGTQYYLTSCHGNHSASGHCSVSWRIPLPEKQDVEVSHVTNTWYLHMIGVQEIQPTDFQLYV